MKYIYTKDIIRNAVEKFISCFEGETTVTDFYEFNTEPFVRNGLLHSYEALATIAILKNNVDADMDCQKIDRYTIVINGVDNSKIDDTLRIMKECGWETEDDIHSHTLTFRTIKNSYYDVNIALHQASGIPAQIIQGYLVINGLANSTDSFCPCKDDYTLMSVLTDLIDDDDKLVMHSNDTLTLTLGNTATEEDADYLRMVLRLLFIEIGEVTLSGNTININYKFLF